MTASRAANAVVAQQTDPTRVEPPTARRVSPKSKGYHASIFLAIFWSLSEWNLRRDQHNAITCEMLATPPTAASLCLPRTNNISDLRLTV